VSEKIRSAGGEGERRIVTVLFCDLVGSTPLGERLGPERFKVVMDQFLGRVIAAISVYEGTVAQVMGDGVLAFFGAPLAHEDEAQRALLAALDIREAVAAFSRDLEAAYGMPVRIRIGLHTGPIVLTKVTDVLQVTYNALGDTVTTAARLQSAATPDSIVASEAVVQPIMTLFDVRPLGPLHLKGKPGPVSAYEVMRKPARMTKVRGIEGLASPLVGRDREVVILRAGVQAVEEGRGQIVAIVGEARLGKSRLIAEVRQHEAGVRWLEGRCLSYAGGIPYFPFIDMLREWLGVSMADPEAKVRIELCAILEALFPGRVDLIYPYLGTMLRLSLEPDVATRITGLSAESLQHETFRAFGEWAAVVAARQPLALILDDIHWADGASLALLQRLLEITEVSPLLLCLLFRPEREHGSWKLNDLARQRYPHRHIEVTLQPLLQADADRLVENLLVMPEFPHKIRDLILQRAEGNPFFVEEIIRELIESGILIKEKNRWRATRTVAVMDIPENVHGVLRSRMDRLPDDARRVLKAASVIGRLFPLDLLKDAVGSEDGHIVRILAELQRHELVVERRRIPAPEYPL
jgi:class 3 adenylate cyclase